MLRRSTVTPRSLALHSGDKMPMEELRIVPFRMGNSGTFKCTGGEAVVVAEATTSACGAQLSEDKNML